MLTNKEFNRFIKFEKTIEDLYDDAGVGVIGSFNRNAITHKPQFVTDSLFNLDRLDDILLGRYGERFLNKMGSQEYDVNAFDELIYPANLDNLAEEITSVYYRKWDNLLYLYLLEMGIDYNPIENYASQEKTTYNSVTDTRTKDGTDTETTTYNSVKDERKHTGSDTDTTTYNSLKDEQKHTGSDTDTTTYNSVTDTRTKDGTDTDTTTFNSVKDELSKTGSEKTAHNADVKQRPLKTATKITDEYGENGLNGIKDTTTFNRHNKETDTAGNGQTPFTATDETAIAGMNSNGGTIGAFSDTSGTGNGGYNQSEKKIHNERGEHSKEYEDLTGSTESTERIGKHSSINVSGGDIQNGEIIPGDLQSISQLSANDNYEDLSYNNRKDTNIRTGSQDVEHEYDSTDTNVKTGSEDVEHEYDSTNTNTRTGSHDTEHEYDSTDTNTRTGSQENEIEYDSTDTNVKTGNFTVEKTGNIGVMTASQMIESAWNGEIERNFIDIVLQDVADFISLRCY